MALRFSRLSLSAIPLVLLACGGADETSINQPGNDSGGNDPDTSAIDGANNPDASPDTSVRDSGLTCNAPMANCSGNPADGCNINLSNDNANCGGCNIVCNTTCTNGTCPLIGSDAGAPPKVGDFACLAVDSKNVYWATGLLANGGGAVYSVPINGGNWNTVIGNQDRPHGIASDGTYVFYANASQFNQTTGGVYRVPVGGGAATTIATNQAFPNDVAIDATNVYWANTGDGTVWSSDKNGQNPKKLGGGGGGGHAQNIRVDGTNVYWTDSMSGVVNRMAKGGGPITVMSTNGGAPGARGLAIDGTTAYVASSMGGNSALLTYPLNASNTAAVQLVPNQFIMLGVATDGTNVYWVNAANSAMNVQPNTGTVNRATVGGANPTQLAKGQNFPGCVALDGTSVYWINLGGGMIVKTGK